MIKKTLIHLQMALLLLVIGFSLSLPPMAAYPPPLAAVAEAASGNAGTFDNTNIMDDLNASTIDGEAFNISNYPAAADAAPQVINIVEYAYTARVNQRAAYALYVYLYNPAQLDIAKGNNRNKIQLANTFDADGNATNYDKYALRFCCESEDKLFYKFKVTSIGDIVDALTVDSERFYSASGIEISTYGSATGAVEYPISATWIYSGFAKGCDVDVTAESTLSCVKRASDSIKLDVHHSNYMTGYSGYKFLGMQKSINTIYFQLSNSDLAKYGDFSGLKIEYNRQYTAPVLIIDDYDLYQSLSRLSGAVIPGTTDITSLSAVESALKSAGYSAPSYITHMRLYYYLASSATRHNDKYIIAPLVVYTNGESATHFTLSSTDLIELLRSYDKTHQGGLITVNGVEYSQDVFNIFADELTGEIVKEIDISDVENIQLKDIENLTGESAHKLFNIFYGTQQDAALEEIKPIVEVTYDDVIVANAYDELLINRSDIEDLRSYVTDAQQNDSRVFAVRYDISDYMTAEFPNIIGNDPGGYLALSAVYLGLDVIWLKFNKNSVERIIPVVATPSDIAGGITPPPVSTGQDSTWDSFKGFFKSIENWFKGVGDWFSTNWQIIVGVIAGVIGLIIITSTIIAVVKRNKTTVKVYTSGAKPKSRKSKK